MSTVSAKAVSAASSSYSATVLAAQTSKAGLSGSGQ